MKLSSKQREVVSRCQSSVCWFLRSFGKVKHAIAGILPFHPFSYQRSAIKAFREHRFNCFRKCRQSGASKIAGSFALWYAMFFSNKTVLIVSRTDDTAMEFLRDQILFLFDHLPEWMKEIWKPIKRTDHELFFANGSKIRSLTSHPDVLRSNSSSLNIIDEAAFIQNMDVLWSGGFSTLQHGGCLVGDSLLTSQRGLVKIGDLHRDHTIPWEDISLDLATDTGVGHATKSYHNGMVKTKRLTTNDGYSIEASLPHSFRILEKGEYKWKHVNDLQLGDQMVLSDRAIEMAHITSLNTDAFNLCDCGCKLCGQDAGTKQWCVSCMTTVRMLRKSRWKPPSTLTTDLAEFLGILYGDGFCDSSGRFGVSCDRTNVDFLIKLKELIVRLGGTPRDEVSSKDWSVRFNHKYLWLFLVRNGLAKMKPAGELSIPALILSSNSAILAAFLRGLFETNGSITKHALSLSSSSIILIQQAQAVLLLFGIRSKIRAMHRKNGFSDNPQYELRLKTIGDTIKFRERIGFVSERKSLRLDAVVPSKRSHNDRFIDQKSLNDFYEASAGLSSKIRQGILHRIRKGAIARKFVKGLVGLYDQLRNTILGTLAINDLFVDRIVQLDDSFSRTYDITEETKNTYIANGFVSHNSVIVISTTCGVGGWYWSTMTDAEAGANDFNPIIINWWDMDWVIEFVNPLSRQPVRIAPRDGLVACDGSTIRDSEYGNIKLDPVKYGPYWSPWLELQYRGLQEKGEAWKFEQEVLASFVGSGNTVLSKEVLIHIGTTVKEPLHRVVGYQTYVHPSTGLTDQLDFDFPEPDEGLWVWKTPILATPIKKRGNQILDHGQPAHSYAMGIDIATGKGKDFSTIEVIDTDTQEQTAEFMAHCLPREFVKYIDRVGRWYNCALAVVERNNGGDILIDMLRHDIMYPRIWRKKDINDKPRHQMSRTRPRPLKVAPYGFATTAASKPILNKYLIDYLRSNPITICVECRTPGSISCTRCGGTDFANPPEGYAIYSRRLYKQLSTYVRKRDKSGRDTMKTEAEEGAGNFDDLVVALGLSFVGASDAILIDAGNLMPLGGGGDYRVQSGPIIMSDGSKLAAQQRVATFGGPSLLMPMTMAPTELPEMSAQRQLDAYTMQLGAIPMSQGKPLVTPKKFFFSQE